MDRPEYFDQELWDKLTPEERQRYSLPQEAYEAISTARHFGVKREWLLEIFDFVAAVDGEADMRRGEAALKRWKGEIEGV